MTPTDALPVLLILLVLVLANRDRIDRIGR